MHSLQKHHRYVGPQVGTCPQRESTEVENPDYHYITTQDLKVQRTLTYTLCMVLGSCMATLRLT